MNLAKLKFWKGTPEAVPPPGQPDAQTTAVSQPSNVLMFPRADLALPDEDAESRGAPQRAKAPVGLLDEPRIAEFFAREYFKCGFHAGCRYISSDAMERGRQEHIARFQVAMTRVAEEKRSQIANFDRLQIGVEAQSTVVGRQIQIARSHLERQLEELERQASLAASGDGWVRQALHEYEAGFFKGMRTAVDYQLLAGSTP